MRKFKLRYTRKSAGATFGALPALAILVLSVAAFAANPEPKLPSGYSCTDVRAKVAEFGKLRALALENGATW
jgi:hypothetical protein